MNKIIIVDDEKLMREALVEWLNDEGYTVDVASDGPEALEMFKKNSYKSMIVDLNMPGMDGLTLIKKVKEKEPEIKIILITAYPSLETSIEAKKYGAVDYISKPFVPGDLEKLITICGENWKK